MHRHTVSVIITSYNQKRYLVEAIDSVLAQTSTPHEIIVADDRSTDGSAELIKGYVALYPGLIRGIYQQRNVGITQNRNAALRAATGSHVAILDGDDRYLPNNLKQQLAALTEHPGARCAYSDLFYIDSTGVRMRTRDVTVQPSGDILSYVAAGQMGLLRSMLIPYDLIETAGYLDPRFPKHDGFILTLHLAKMAQFAYVPEPLAEYRVHEEGDSRSFSARARLGYLEDVYSEVIRLTKRLPPTELRRIKTAWHLRLLHRRMIADLEEHQRVRAWLRATASLFRHPSSIRELLRLVFRVPVF
jgi:glycosyltransferase involved in cell wall biosynthesis